MKLFEMWCELKVWLAEQDKFNDHNLQEVIDEMDRLESEYEL